MTGRELRGKLEAIHETMDWVEEFLRERNKLSEEAAEKVQCLRNLAEDLFYIVPLE